jgi:hypothetical protein
MGADGQIEENSGTLVDSKRVKQAKKRPEEVQTQIWTKWRDPSRCATSPNENLIAELQWLGQCCRSSCALRNSGAK